jgi:predicted nucleotidyltransferase
VDPVALFSKTVERHPAVRAVRLVGSGARGDTTALSDWATEPPETIGAVVDLYCELRDRRERELGVAVDRQLEAAARGRLATNTVL